MRLSLLKNNILSTITKTFPSTMSYLNISDEITKRYLLLSYIQDHKLQLYRQMFELNLQPETKDNDVFVYLQLNGSKQDILLYLTYYGGEVEIEKLLENYNLSEDDILDLDYTAYLTYSILCLCIRRGFIKIFKMFYDEQNVSKLLIKSFCYDGLEITNHILEKIKDLDEIDDAFIYACCNKKIFYINRLCFLYPSRYSYKIQNRQETDVSYYFDSRSPYRKRNIRKNIVTEYVYHIQRRPIERETECPICLDKVPNVITDCNHQYCKECLSMCKDKCALCRRFICTYHSF